jgi:putative hydrolase of the HAD superfamily
VTNFDNRVVEVLSGLGVVHYFDTIQTPQSAGFRKPDPRIFLRAAGALRVAGGQGASPGRTLMVGDDPLLDLAGAEAAGMTALLVDRRPGPTRSARVIPDLSGVLGWLDRGPELLKNPPAP